MDARGLRLDCKSTAICWLLFKTFADSDLAVVLDDAPCMDPLAEVPGSSLTLDDVNCRDGKLGKFEKQKTQKTQGKKEKKEKNPIIFAIRKNQIKKPITFAIRNSFKNPNFDKKCFSESLYSGKFNYAN